MKLTKGEIKSINEYEQGKFKLDELRETKYARGKEMSWIIVISHGRRELHDSGYPFIKIIGHGVDGCYYNLGRHDHFICRVEANVDAYGKNVFRVCPWGKRKPWVVDEGFWSHSTFEIGHPEYHSKHSETKVILE